MEVTMRAHSIYWALTSAALIACQDGSAPAAMMEESKAAAGQHAVRPEAGGSTRDFGGSCAPCEEPLVEDLALDELSYLGFSAQQLLDLIEGDYAGAAQWRDPCAPGACEAIDDDGCPREAPSFAGTRTVFRIAIERAAERATTHRCAEREPTPDCPGFLTVPIRIELTTDDGLLDERLESELAAEHAQSAGVSMVLDRFSGSLPTALPALHSVEWGIWTGNPGVEADLFALPAPPSQTPHQLLTQLERVSETGDECELGIPMDP
ncbi:MAG TPA: hypothetical protein VK509_02790, partial [Polyangiales bacterium]|nr:hypothetical protein [Polyangiales bacterium]